MNVSIVLLALIVLSNALMAFSFKTADEALGKLDELISSGYTGGPVVRKNVSVIISMSSSPDSSIFVLIYYLISIF